MVAGLILTIIYSSLGWVMMANGAAITTYICWPFVVALMIVEMVRESKQDASK